MDKNLRSCLCDKTSCQWEGNFTSTGFYIPGKAGGAHLYLCELVSCLSQPSTFHQILTETPENTMSCLKSYVRHG